VDGDVIEPYSAGATVARITTFLDTEPSYFPQEYSQALARPGLLREGLAVDPITHGFT
jgi:hypothetical protein